MSGLAPMGAFVPVRGGFVPPTKISGASARGHKLDANTIALYRFDETTQDPRGTGPEDSTGYRWTVPDGGSLLVPYTPIYGHFARKFSGAGGMLRRESAGAADQARCFGPWTVEAFVNIQSLANVSTILTHTGASDEVTANNVIMSARVETTGKLGTFWEYAGAANQSTIAASTTLVVGTWYHLAWVKDAAAKTVAFYIDGVLQGAAVGYANEATLGSGGSWIVGNTFTSGGTPANMWVRDVAFSTVVRDGVWLAANAARRDSDGALITDASTYFSVPMNEYVAADSSGNAHHLVSVPEVDNDNFASPAPGLLEDGGHSKYLDGCTLAPLAHSAPVLAALLSGPFTFEAWIYVSSWSQSEAWGLFCYGDPGVDTAVNNYWVIELETDGSITVDVENGAGVNGALIQSPAGVVPFGERVHIAVRSSVAAGVLTVDIFVDGVRIHTGTGTPFDGATSAGNNPWHHIGRGNAVDTNRFTGYVDDVRLSSVARSDAEILESYQRGVAA